MTPTPRFRRTAGLVAAVGAVLVGLSLALAPAASANAAPSISPMLCSDTLQQGSSGDCVVQLQNRLNELGANIAADGAFGPGTESAVLAFQGRSRIGFDGVVGPNTQNQLNNPGDVNLNQVDTGTIGNYINQVFGSDGPTAQRIATCESSLRETASNYNTNGTYDIGVFQDNTVHANGDFTGFVHDMYYYQANIDKAHELYVASGGFSPWNSSIGCWG